jgi:pimeloyl-ACP methyl ester carboxylesterase
MAACSAVADHARTLGADYRYLLPLKALADDYRVVFYDQRGTGLSPRVPADSITLDSFVTLRHFRHARVAVVPEAGHFMFNDQPERSVAVVRDFLAAP